MGIVRLEEKPHASGNGWAKSEQKIHFWDITVKVQTGNFGKWVW